jgi:hypothetical protein
MQQNQRQLLPSLLLLMDFCFGEGMGIGGEERRRGGEEEVNVNKMMMTQSTQ